MIGITTVLQAGVAAPLAGRWKDGSPEYHSVLVARRDRATSSRGRCRRTTSRATWPVRRRWRRRPADGVSASGGGPARS
jgi:hypothetical protein